jgi:hypothetical protein
MDPDKAATSGQAGNNDATCLRNALDGRCLISRRDYSGGAPYRSAPHFGRWANVLVLPQNDGPE